MELDLNNQIESEDDLRSALANDSRNDVAALNLSNNQLGKRGAALLAKAQGFDRLTSLELRFNGLGPNAMRLIMDSPLVAHLTELDVSENDNLGDEGACAIFASRIAPQLKVLRLARCNLSNVAASKLALAPMDALEQLTLPSNAIEAPGMRALAASPVLAKVRLLNIGENPLCEGAAALAASEHTQTLEELYVYKAEAGDAFLEALASSDMSRITTLSAFYNGFGAAGMRALATWRGLASVIELDLNSNYVGDVGGQALVASPYLTSMRVLRLRDCGIKGQLDRSKLPRIETLDTSESSD